MGAFGERLRREREMRGITLDEISESTKISRRHLESLESEDFEALPGGVFNKGFVRAYARYLGIDEDQAVADYSTAASEEPPPPDKFPLEIHYKPDPKLNPRRSPIPLVLAVIALLAVLAVLWMKNKSRKPEAPPAGTTTSAPMSVPTMTQSSARGEASPAVAAGLPKLPARAATPTPTRAPTPDRTFVVVIKANEDAWVSLTADGKKTWEGVLKADSQKLVRAGRRIVITTGNAGGIQVSHNGKPVGTIGNESEVKTLTFSPGGLVQ